MYTASYLSEKLSKALEATHVDVHDDSDGCGAKFSVVIVSPKFEGLPLLQRHRLVNSTLKEELPNIHAFSQKTLTPAQWEEQKSKETQ
ncbi:bolA-like protein 2 [Hetaerina americana]|uniref:bolA-like protein 2 n=1 Tax=Hetaerina americana TaxID=62018 RepID=UPI003A7F119D